MAYTSMKKLIIYNNAKYKNGEMKAEKYQLIKADYVKKLNVFYAVSQLTDEEYTELMSMFLTV